MTASPVRVLLIEDNDQNRYLVTFLLEKNGYTVVAAADGPQALALVRTMVPAIIVVDIQLPTMDGYALTRALRSQRSLANIPIVAVTSYAMAGDRDKTIEAGCDDYDTKPIDLPRLLAKIEAQLQKAKAASGTD